jgi:hypothetical protein
LQNELVMAKKEIASLHAIVPLQVHFASFWLYSEAV